MCLEPSKNRLNGETFILPNLLFSLQQLLFCLYPQAAFSFIPGFLQLCEIAIEVENGIWGYVWLLLIVVARKQIKRDSYIHLNMSEFTIQAVTRKEIGGLELENQ